MADDDVSIEQFLRAHVTPETVDSFLAPRATTADVAAAVADVAEASIEGALARLMARKDAGKDASTALALRNVAEAVWRDLGAAEPCLAGAPLDTRALVDTLRTAARTDTARRVDALVAFMGAAVRTAAAARLKDVRLASTPAKLRVAAELVRVWEATVLTRPAAAHKAGPVSAVSAATGGGIALRSPLGATKGAMASVAEALTRRFFEGAPLASPDLRRLQAALQTASITGVLAFGYHVLLGDWEDVFLELPRRVVLGVPAMLREARPPRPGEPSPAAIKPKPEGGALPPPAQFVYTVGRGKGGHVGLGGVPLLPGGGLLAVLPGWSGVTPDGRAYAHYWRVDPARRIGTVLVVTEAERGPAARVKLTFEVDLPARAETEAEDEEDEKDKDDKDTEIDWIDAQRDFEGNLVLSWGGYNKLTGGVAWTCYMGLAEADEYAKGEDPFRTLAEEDVDDMFVARLESAEAVDFRDHGNLLTAEVKHVEESTARGRFLSPVTTVVYHHTIVGELLGVEAAALWGTAAAYVVWTKDGHAATVAGATSAADLRDTSVATSRTAVPASDEAGVVAIAPWWRPLS